MVQSKEQKRLTEQRIKIIVRNSKRKSKKHEELTKERSLAARTKRDPKKMLKDDDGILIVDKNEIAEIFNDHFFFIFEKEA